MVNPTLTFGVDLSALGSALKEIDKRTDKLSQNLNQGLKDAQKSYNNLQYIKNPLKIEETIAKLNKLKADIKKATIAKFDLKIDNAKKSRRA
ncbi:hypothetical protein A0W86_08490 [Campylobacter fetus]|nr:hypothetical protein [Campylobacter fetus]